MSRRGRDEFPLGRNAARAPDVVALGSDASKKRLSADRGWAWLLHAELEFLSQCPAVRAAAPRNICARLVGRYSEKLLIATLE